MTHLRRHLEATGILAAEQLDAALRRQQIYGGSLDTVLLELEILDAHSLNELLHQACGLAVVPPELLDDGNERPWGAIPEELVDIGWAVPLILVDGQLHVAVHPDFPNERLGALYRGVPGVVPMVTPECSLEKMAAEQNRSVVPQRYAVLCAAYMSAMRRRPSVSDAGYPLIPSLAPSEDTGRGRTPPAPASAPEARENAMRLRQTQFYGPGDAPTAENFSAGVRNMVERAAAAVDTQKTLTPTPPSLPAQSSGDAPPPLTDPELPAVPEYVEPGSEGAEPLPPPIGGVEPPPVPSGDPTDAPPIRFTKHGTMIGTAQRLEARFEEAEAARSMEGARQSLAEARTRDAVMEAVVRGAMAISPRVGLFRIKGDVLVGLPTPRSAIEDLEGKSVPMPAGSELAKSIEYPRWAGTTREPGLSEAVGLDEVVPCVTLRIDVAGRPTLLLYLDHAGREILPAEANVLGTLVDAASDAFENVIKARRAAQTAAVSTELPAAEVSPPQPQTLAPAPPTGRMVAPPPPTFGTTEPARWGPAPSELDDSTVDVAAGLGLVAAPAEAGRKPRDTAVDGSPPTSKEQAGPHQLRMTIMVTPPPGVVPPPPMHDDERGTDRAPETLTGLPSVSDTNPGFIPPTLDTRSTSGIIPLASPIDQPSVRGRIELEDEDWAPSSEPESDEDQQSRIDEVIEGLARGQGDIAAFRALGASALTRLAALFPGPLEVLRRDLRALPPPSAHGPHIRTAIRIGQPVVPYILDLFPHPDPDVRFYAAFLFQELRDERCMSHLSRLAFDGSGDVRIISMRVLETYSRVEGFNEAVATVRSELDGSNRTRQLYAARAVGTLRDVVSIPELIELLSSKDRFIQEAALESLCSVTGQQHGLKPHRWKSWYAEHGHDHRIQWIIDSLRHRDLPVRRWAHDELIRVTGHRIPFSPLGDKKSRDVAASAWTEWWNQAGRNRFGVSGDRRPRA